MQIVEKEKRENVAMRLLEEEQMQKTAMELLEQYLQFKQVPIPLQIIWIHKFSFSYSVQVYNLIVFVSIAGS